MIRSARIVSMALLMSLGCSSEVDSGPSGPEAVEREDALSGKKKTVAPGAKNGACRKSEDPGGQCDDGLGCSKGKCKKCGTAVCCEEDDSQFMDKGQCFAKGKACDAVNNKCATCGKKAGQPCCEAVDDVDACPSTKGKGPLVCNDTMTCETCGSDGKLCCDDDTCSGDNICSESLCHTCGRLGDLCCDGNECVVGGICKLNSCEECGVAGKPCCPIAGDDGCFGPAYCDGGVVCRESPTPPEPIYCGVNQFQCTDFCCPNNMADGSPVCCGTTLSGAPTCMRCGDKS